MSYGTNSPFGLKPVLDISSAAPTQVQSFWIASGFVPTLPVGGTGIFTNDPLIQSAAGGIDLAPAAAGPILGTFQGCSYVDTNGVPQELPYILSGTATLGAVPVECFVTIDPDILYEIQIATSGGPSNAPAITATMVNNNAFFNSIAGTYNALVAGATVPTALVGTTPASNPVAGSTRTGLSAYYLSSATIAAGNPTYPLKIVALTTNVNNNIYAATQGNIIFNTAIVQLNSSYYLSGTGTAGV